MAFQSTVRDRLTGGFVGDIVIAGEIRAQTGVLKTTNPALNIIGNALTHVAGQDGQFIAGGAGVFAGVLSSRNQYALQSAGLAPSLVLPNNLPVEAVRMTTGILLNLTTAANIGDSVAFSQADGTWEAVAPGGEPTEDYTLVPTAKVILHNIPAAGLAIVQFTE